jgi:AraC-like DNA-binding protein
MVFDPLTRSRAEERVTRGKRHGFIFFGITHMTDLGARVFEFSTENLAEQDRIAFWREHYGNVMLRVDIEPAPGQIFVARNRTLALPGLQLMEGSSSPARITRGGRFLDDGNDDIVFAINQSGSAIIESGGRAQILKDHQAVVLSCGEAATFDRTQGGRSLTLRVPRATLEKTVIRVDDALMRQIPGDRGAMGLLENYAGWLLNAAGSLDQQLLDLSVQHVQDLLALTIGPVSDFADAARSRGLKAARLKLAKSFIVAHSHRRDISISTVAASLNVTPRYVQRLFEAEGTTFSEFLIGQRLTRAHRLLCEPSSNHSAISTIAYDVGFGDLSYFNRRFRRQFGSTPREVRGDRAG